MNLYLIRHGCSISNELKLVTGTPLDVLSRKGKRQVNRLSNWIKNTKLKFDDYFVSHWKRAQQTAYHLFPDKKWQIDNRIGETDAGMVADWSINDFLIKYPDFYDNAANAYPGGESHLDLNIRVIDWFSEQITNKRKNVVIVAHAGPISCILQHMFGIHMLFFPAFLPSYASITMVKLKVIDCSYCAPQLMSYSSGPWENFSF